MLARIAAYMLIVVIDLSAVVGAFSHAHVALHPAQRVVSAAPILHRR